MRVGYLQKQVSIAPLAVFRMVFGAVMLVGVVRFAYNGWIHDLYVIPGYFFTYQGFEWIHPLDKTGMYVVFAVMGVSAFGIMTGLLYRLLCPLFFLSFTYVELIDKTTYLNHYYFVSIIAFLLCVLPAHRFCSLDVRLGITKPLEQVPAWMPDAIKLQLSIVFICAGIAKINFDWLFSGQPLSIWLQQKGDVPLVGKLLTQPATAYVFAWIGLLYDLLIPFFLWNRKYRWYAFAMVVLFHWLTWVLFPIGMFPFIMIGAAIIFLPDHFHSRIIKWIRKADRVSVAPAPMYRVSLSSMRSKLVFGMLLLHFVIQAALPFRYVMYPGHLFWTEEGFRFSWRVMLMDKQGDITFNISDRKQGGSITVFPSQYLTSFQVRMMSTQPDMILQFAHFLRDEYRGKKVIMNGREVVLRQPVVKTNSFVSLNGRKMRRFIDPNTDLASVQVSLKHKTWITQFKY